MITETQDPTCLMIHLDASRLHESVFAHELGHIRNALVDYIEDYRIMRDVSDLSKVVQFQHLQSFVLDLNVNDFIESRGFDMSIITSHQTEAIRTIAEHCARCDVIKTKRAAIGLAETIAAAMLEQIRWPKEDVCGLNACLAMIETSIPWIYRLAEQYMKIVRKHGYYDSSSVRRVIDECLLLSFNATGDDFDLDRDLIEMRPTEWMYDKFPSFLPGFPVPVKLDIWKAIARHRIGSPFGCKVVTNPSGRGVITLNDGSGQCKDEVHVPFELPRHLVDPPPQRPKNPWKETANTKRTSQNPFMHNSSDPGIQAPDPMVEPSIPIVTAPHWRSYPIAGIQATFLHDKNYMAGLGLWLSRVAFEEQEIGEPLYLYAWNDPIGYVDPEGLWPETGTATCFSDTRLFCNHAPNNPKCPTYSHGMTGSWPNVTQKKIPGCCGNDKRTYNSGLSESVECGSTLTVGKGKCSVKITVIDAGPSSSAASHAIVDLSPQAAKALWTCLHPTKPPQKGHPLPPKKGKHPKRHKPSHFSCSSFEETGVKVNG